ncbi:MAG: CRISPR-associated endonuclease Cas3'' [Candidatus Baldrarchaeia archaeon]
MKPCAFTGQSLLDHTKGCLRIIEQLLKKNPTYTAVTARRLRTASEGRIVFEESEIEEIIKCAVLLHDVGKAYAYFQKNFDEKCRPRGKSGFPYHEMLSAIACYEYGNNLWALQDNDKTLLLVLSVLNHHHAFKKSLSEILFSQPFIGLLPKKLSNIVESQIYKDNNFENLLRAYDIPPEVLLITRNDVNSFHNWLKACFRDLSLYQHQWFKLYVLIMNPLLVADNLDAYYNRKNLKLSKSKRLFLEELRKVIE